MSVKEFLRMMPQIDRKYLDEAYRITAGRPAKKRGDIMKKTAKIAIAAAMCIAVIGGGAAVIYKLNHRVDVSPNKHGSGYVGNAPETEKFRATLPEVRATAPDAVPDMSYAPLGSARLQNQMSIYATLDGENMAAPCAVPAFSDKGCYSIGNPTRTSRKHGICYTDFETGETVYLCAKPECLHDGSDYCPATNSDYALCNLVWYENMLYALADKQSDRSCVLLKIQPDGTGLEEIAVLDDRGFADQTEMIAYRGALWATGTVREITQTEAEPGQVTTDERSIHCIWHYELTQNRLTAVAQAERTLTADSEKASKTENGLIPLVNLQADGDYVYVRKQQSIGDGMPNGIYQINAANGVVTRLEQMPADDFYMAAAGKLYYITMEEGDPAQNTYDIYTMHTVENGVETAAVRVPRGWHYNTDGNYLFAEVNGNLLMVCDMQGNVLKREEFPTGERSIFSDKYNFAYADGILYCVYRHLDQDPVTTTVRRIDAVPLEQYLAGTAGFETVCELYGINDEAWKYYDAEGGNG